MGQRWESESRSRTLLGQELHCWWDRVPWVADKCFGVSEKLVCIPMTWCHYPSDYFTIFPCSYYMLFMQFFLFVYNFTVQGEIFQVEWLKRLIWRGKRKGCSCRELRNHYFRLCIHLSRTTEAGPWSLWARAGPRTKPLGPALLSWKTGL